MVRQRKIRSSQERKLVLAARAALGVLGSMPADFDEYYELSDALKPYRAELEYIDTRICPDCGGTGATQGFVSDGQGGGEPCGLCG